MDENIDNQLEKYSKINFDHDLENLTTDVRKQLRADHSSRYRFITFAERLFGMPISLSGSAIASTLIIGIIMGAQFQPENSLAHTDMLDLEVFSPINSNLPSTLLDPNNETR